MPFGGMGMGEMLVVGIIALLLFGNKLPEVAKSLGKGFMEFKRGMMGLEDEVRTAVHTSPPPAPTSRPVPEEEQEELTAPKFEPPVPRATADAEPAETKEESQV